MTPEAKGMSDYVTVLTNKWKAAEAEAATLTAERDALKVERDDLESQVTELQQTIAGLNLKHALEMHDVHKVYDVLKVQLSLLTDPPTTDTDHA